MGGQMQRLDLYALHIEVSTMDGGDGRSSRRRLRPMYVLDWGRLVVLERQLSPTSNVARTSTRFWLA
jgi:hypothetical protein